MKALHSVEIKYILTIGKFTMNTNNELKTRLVFIDTCAFESKNYNFGINSLERIQKYIEQGKIHLLLPDITKSEIEKHLKAKAEVAATSLKKILKDRDIKILKAISDLPFSGELIIPTKEQIHEKIHEKFLEFIDSPNVEVVSTEGISPKIIFDNYFNSHPPFNNPNKKNEFPDAFVLEAINEISKNRNHDLYVISTDPDMKSFINLHNNLLHLNNINELNSLIIHNDTELAEPANFADQVFEYLKDRILEIAEDKLYNGEFEATEFSEYLSDDIISSVDITSIEISEKNLQIVSTTEAQYQINFVIDFSVDFSVPDYDNSPFDPEDNRYLYIRSNKFTKEYKESYSANITILYEDGIKNNAEIFDFSFEDTTFELN